MPRPKDPKTRLISAAPKPSLAVKWISPTERQERLSKGLCFNCDNKWVRGHKYPGKFLLVMADDEDDAVQESEEYAVESGDISILNSLIGQGSPRSLQLWGTICLGSVHILIDNGSIHNFVRPDVVEKMHLPVQSTKPFKVYIGSRETLLCESICSWVALSMQGLTMEVDLYVLPMKRPDVVLGIQWLQKLGKVPATLPPHHIIDHRIHLLPNTKPVNVRPYHYPYYQKSQMEKLVKEMMEQDYRLLNEVRIKDKFPIPIANEMFLELSEASILGLPNFEDMFIVEAGALDVGTGSVLIQNEKPLSYFSRKLGPRMRVAATYQKELFAIVEAAYKWRYTKIGATNLVAHALSRVHDEADDVITVFMALSQPLVSLVDDLRKQNETLDELKVIHLKLERKEVLDGFWREHGMILFRDTIIRIKYSTQAPASLLQPLLTPSEVWEDVSMDFITGLPVCKDLSVILVVVDRFTKYAHFGTLPASFNAPKVAEVFMDMVVKHHGIRPSCRIEIPFFLVNSGSNCS
ncbi:transposon ty3-I gag-pol polyprotein, partial [Tanacetum coccineum]